MNLPDLLTWLQAAPQLAGQQLHYSYLPAFSGWSLTIPKAETRTDILGHARTRWELKLTRRISIQSDAERLAIVAALEELSLWAVQNPPVTDSGTRPAVRRTGLSTAALTDRNASGVEDFSLTLSVAET